MNSLPIAFLDGFSPVVMVMIGAFAVMLFGKQLPDIARTFGRNIMQFKKSLRGLQEDFRSAAMSATSEFRSAVSGDSSESYDGSSSSASYDYSPSSNGHKTDDADHEVASAPKFVPPPAEPQGDEPKTAGS